MGHALFRSRNFASVSIAHRFVNDSVERLLEK